ncbi:MAG: monovalent cation/H(+) antiporter subunit G [Aquificaceae bacterium]|nr:monovalent cation/H(+) antiporter subunit G [Aquificaceae bacterium]MDW8422724.1 monovalent cation/H(+) antiporter subunit G [Aquificaceae bacterium]
MLIEIASLTFTILGVFFLLAGSVGLIRLRDTYSRIHAITKADVLGFGFLVLGLMLSTRTLSEVLKLLLTWLLVVSYSSLVSYAIAHRKRKRDVA